MLLGIWTNFDDLEESLSYPELVAIVEAKRQQEYRTMKFQASLKGINLDGEVQEENLVEKMKRRVRAQQAGLSEEEMGFRENVAAAGFSFKTE